MTLKTALVAPMPRAADSDAITSMDGVSAGCGIRTAYAEERLDSVHLSPSVASHSAASRSDFGWLSEAA